MPELSITHQWWKSMGTARCGFRVHDTDIVDVEHAEVKERVA